MLPLSYLSRIRLKHQFMERPGNKDSVEVQSPGGNRVFIVFCMEEAPDKLGRACFA